MHTTEIGHLASETEAAHALVEKLLTENTQLVGKVNELYVELDHNGLQQETSAEMAKSVHVADTTAVGLHPRGEATEMQKSLASDSMYETSAKMLVPDIRVQSQEGCVRGDLDYQKTMLFSDSSEIIETDEIVQIPLEENENKPIDVEAVNIAQKTEIPISDAPLIGAPFRLISFVARYVSGADLVEKSSVNSAR
ncbi:hypothetical protein ACH5RR_005081 [Cinchona calisaya]|uniref:Uncharacterized protein n=1 Tax=Cinchona calisaya TaxID=153742 RepID=A0ABD3AZB5_9GENT